MKFIRTSLLIWVALLALTSSPLPARAGKQNEGAVSNADLPVRIGIAGNSYPYNYTCNADSKPDPKGTRACGIEVDLFNRICSDMNMQCTWVLHPWAASAGKDPFRDPGGLLYDLIHPTNGASADSDESYPYDVAISSIGASPARRLQMLFSISYYSPKHIIVGDVVHPVVRRKD